MAEPRRATISARPEGGLSREHTGYAPAKPVGKQSDSRRATVILIQRGDPEISRAIAGGMVAARGDSLSHGRAVTAPSEREPCEPAERVEIISAEAGRDRIVAQLVKVAVGNSKTAEDYEIMLVRARGMYGDDSRPGPMRTLAGKLLLGWAMLCLGVRKAHRAQDRVLGGGAR